MLANPFLTPILDRAKRDPDGLFGIFHEGDGWSEVTLRQMLERALRFSALIGQRRLPSGSTIMLVLRHGLDAPACFLGTMFAGMVPSFLPCPSTKQDHALYWAQHKIVLGYNHPPLLLTVDDLLGDMAGCVAEAGLAGTTEVLAVSALDDYAPADWPVALPGAGNVGLLQHSSGTTGMKKGVALSYGSIARQLAAYRDCLGIAQAPARIVSWLPLYHDMGLISSFLLPAWLGVPILSIDPFVWVARPDLFFDAIERFGGTHAWLPNFAFLHLARRVRAKRRWDLSGLRMLVSCSEPCKAAAFDAFVERFAEWGVRPEMLQTCYAMAETVFAVSQSDAAAPVRRLVVDAECIRSLGRVRVVQDEPGVSLLSNGAPLAGCEVAVLREDAFVGSGEIGEICVSADYMFSGYNRNEAATEAAFFGTWYRTGDIGFLEQGDVFVVGRMKDVIIVNGKNVFVHDIEAAVSRVEGVKPGRCVAFGRYSEKAGSELLIVVAERDAEGRDQDMARDINRAVVDEVGVACADIRVVEPGWLVKTTSGKTSRADNALKYGRDFVAASG